VVIAGGIAWYAIGRSSASAEVIPPRVSGGPAIVQAGAHQVPDIPGVTAYVTTGWPQASDNGPAAQALAHSHVTRPVTYSVIPPVGGQHNATWMNCGIYDQPVLNERAVHNMEHGAIWITYLFVNTRAPGCRYGPIPPWGICSVASSEAEGRGS